MYRFSWLFERAADNVGLDDYNTRLPRKTKKPAGLTLLDIYLDAHFSHIHFRTMCMVYYKINHPNVKLAEFNEYWNRLKDAHDTQACPLTPSI
jgi:hypothetical protein